MVTQAHTPELISIEEFATRMGVSRTTAFAWIKNGDLQPGRHFIRIGRVIRFAWGEELIRRLHEDSINQMDTVNVGESPKTLPEGQSARPLTSGVAIDLEYR